MATSNTGECAKCSEPGSLICSTCSEGLNADGNLSPTYYCSGECQKSDHNHDVICKSSNARKQLYRGGLLLKEIFHEFCEATFFVNIERAWVDNGGLSFEGERLGAGKPPIYRYPTQSVPFEFKKALITWNRSNDGVGYMYHLIEKILMGITYRLPEELQIVVGTMQQKCKMLSGYKLPKLHELRHDLHMVVSISLKDDNLHKYVLDPSGAQYGIDEPVMTETKYLQQLSAQTYRIDDIGHEAEAIEDMTNGEMDHNLEPWFDDRALTICSAVAQAVLTEVKQIEEENGVKLHNILQQPRNAFKASMESIVGRAKQVIRATASSGQWDSLPKNKFLDWKKEELCSRYGRELTQEELYSELETVLFKRNLRLKDYYAKVDASG